MSILDKIKGTSWKSVLGTVAPTIATALGGPLAGVAVKTLGAILLGDEDAGESEVAKVIASSSPETLLKLKEAEQAFTLRMRELDIDLDKLAAQDRASAREREAKVGDKTTRVLAYIIVTAFIGMLFSVLFGGARADTVLIGTLIGYISAKCEQVVTYYFGSSMGSARKDNDKARLTELLAKKENA